MNLRPGSTRAHLEWSDKDHKEQREGHEEVPVLHARVAWVEQPARPTLEAQTCLVHLLVKTGKLFLATFVFLTTELKDSTKDVEECEESTLRELIDGLALGNHLVSSEAPQQLGSTARCSIQRSPAAARPPSPLYGSGHSGDAGEAVPLVLAILTHALFSGCHGVAIGSHIADWLWSRVHASL